MLTRQERTNMINFILKLKDLDFKKLMYMTDEEIEHCYKVIYSTQHSECQI